MKIVGGVLTHEVFKHKRHDLLLRTLVSMSAEISNKNLVVLDNGSKDGTDKLVYDLFERFRYDYHLAKTGPRNAGSGMNLLAQLCCNLYKHVVVLSNDDVEWKPGFVERLRAFWAEAPADVLLAGGILEPEYSWNQIHGAATIGGQRCLFRDSVGGASWSFRAHDWELIGPVPEHQMGQDDLPTCQRLISKHYRIAALDLATHIGEERSTWGNKTPALPLDLVRWGFRKDTSMWNKDTVVKGEVSQLFRQRHAEIGLHFQTHLYELVRHLKPAVVVETGVRTGVSTHYILAALEANQKGRLFSCDPLFRDQRGALEKFTMAEMGIPKGVERWIFLGKRSDSALAEIAQKEPVWDLFVHDSDHSADVMQLELEQAWKHLRVGGYIVCNAFTGMAVGSTPHKVWASFVERHGGEWSMQGDCAFLQKPEKDATVVAAEAAKVVETKAAAREEEVDDLLDEEFGEEDEDDAVDQVVEAVDGPEDEEEEEDEEEDEEEGDEEDEEEKETLLPPRRTS